MLTLSGTATTQLWCCIKLVGLQLCIQIIVITKEEFIMQSTKLSRR